MLQHHIRHKGFEVITEVVEAGMLTGKLKVLIKMEDGYPVKRLEVNCPLFKYPEYITYSDNYYSNVIYGVIPSNEFITIINGVDGFYKPRISMYSVTYLPMPEDQQVTSTLMEAANTKGIVSGNINDLDNWYYCRASDFSRLYIEKGLKLLIDNSIENGIFSRKILDNAINTCLKLFRYIDHKIKVKEWSIIEHYNRVYIPEIFAGIEDASIRSKLLDLTCIPQSATMNQFTLKKGVILDETETGTEKSVLDSGAAEPLQEGNRR